MTANGVQFALTLGFKFLVKYTLKNLFTLILPNGT